MQRIPRLATRYTCQRALPCLFWPSDISECVQPLLRSIIYFAVHLGNYMNRKADKSQLKYYLKYQRRQSGFISGGGRGSGWKKIDFSNQISEKVRFFRQFHTKISIFPGKFSKNFDFFRQFKKSFDFPAKITHLHHFRTYFLYMKRYTNISRPLCD